MLDKIIHFSIHNKLIIGIFTLAWILWGGYSLTQLPIDAVPDITNNQVQIITYSPSLAAQEVERLITFPIELTMATIPSIDEMRSISRFGLSVVTIVFKEDIDVFWARNQVFERLQQAQQKIPVGVGSPELMPITTGLGEIYQYIIRPKKGYESKYSLNELRTIQDWIVRRQMLGTEGVADVSSFGGYVKQYEIAINPEKLRSMNLTISDLFTALEKNNQNTGGSYIDKRPTAYFIRSEGLINSLEDIEKIVVKAAANGLPIFMRDIAKVQFGNAVRYGAMTRNNEGEVVGGIVMMLKGENSSSVITKVKARMLQIEKTLPEGIVIEAFLDRTKLVNSAIKTVGTNLMEGALIVIFVLVLMLGNLRAGLVVASVIPLALLFAIMMMNLFGVSGNLMSLGAIDFGLIVDGAVIIVEATLHHLYNRPTLPSPMERVISTSPLGQGAGVGARLTQAEMDNEVYLSAVKIRNSAAFGEIIIMIVYLPLLTLVGIEGKMFKPMAQTVAFAILGAFILSITYVPMISALLLSKNISHKVTVSDRIIAFCYRFYKPLIEGALRRPLLIIFASVLLFMVSVGIFRTLGGEFIPTLDEGDFAVEVRLPAGSALDETVKVSMQIANILKENFPEVKEVVGKIGSSEIPTDPMPLESCDMMVILKEKNEWTSATTTEELAEKMQAKLDKNIAGVTFSFQQPIQMRFNELMTGAKQDAVLKIYGEDLDILAREADKLAKVIQPVEGVSDLYVEKVTGLQQVVVSFDREKIAQFGLSVEEANRMLNIAFAGSTAGTIYEGDRRYDLVLRLAKENRQSIEDVRNLFITNAKNEQIPLSQLAEVEFKEGVYQVQRDGAKRRIIVAFNVRGRDVESIVGEIQQKVEKQLKLPAGCYITYGGSFENLQEAKARLLVAVPVALGLIFVLLYFTFRSVRQSLLIFSAIPLSAIGGIFALWLRDMPFSISAGVGFIALFGVSVLNGIVLISEFNFLKNKEEESFVGTQTTAEGESSVGTQTTADGTQTTAETTSNQQLINIIIEGAKTRLRPILMTAAVASLGFLPMAISQGAGGEVQKPLATVVIGGLLSATLLTLFVLPALYLLIEDFFEKRKSLPIPTSMSAILLVTFLGLFFPQLSWGQTAAVKNISLETAIQTSLTQNLSIKAGNYEIDMSKEMRKTATDMGKASVLWQAGQYNSIKFDNSFSINQTMPLFVWNKQAQQLQAQLRGSELKLAVTQNDLTYQVKIAYYQLLFLQARRQLLQKQDSLFLDLVRIAKVRYRTGEGRLLEQTAAENQQQQTYLLLMQNQSDMAIFQRQLQFLMHTEDSLVLSEPMRKRITPVDNREELTSKNPLLTLNQQQVEIAKKTIGVEKAKLLPDVTLGYFNQSLIGTQIIDGKDQFFNGSKRFQGFYFGLSVPLWAKPQKARIQAAKVQEQLNTTNFEFSQRAIETQYAQAVQEYRKFQTNLAYYENSALATAKLLLEQSGKAYQQGEISYVEYAQALNQSLITQANYLETINGYNQAINKIEFLLGNL
ncbi:MAG: CusA/CzcA family heavy metal efflux RND transporter [Cytophagales bacterium]|nr:MAG: CusA/CzcA family heavy metal efflux RND transporter [Cytophagales bacterium]